MNLKQAIIPLVFLPMTSAMAEHIETEKLDDLIITTGHKLFPNTLLATPTYKITESDIERVNATTIEDAVMQAPSVFVRRRFIGDTNGTTGIRGSSYFQTAHTMVFSDGLRLHNMLQTVWNGAPRWSLVAPNSVKQIKVMYGPYSAEHSGNSFGGTIEMTTKMPEEFGMDMEVMGMVQDSNRFGRDEVLTGHKEFISAGNKIGKWSIFGFYNHLENEGQPQSFDISLGSENIAAGATAVTGGYATSTRDGADTYVIGDQGVQDSLYDLYEIKIGYDFTPDLTGLLTVAFEDVLKDRHDGMSFLKDSNGNRIWEQGTDLSMAGRGFNVDESDYGRNRTERQTLTYGYNLSGKINDTWDIDTTAEYFDGYKDTNTAANQSTNNTAYDRTGTVSDTKRWWGTYDLKLATQEAFGRKDMGAMFGYQFNYSDLSYQKWTSNNVETEQRNTFASQAGGATSMNSAFGQVDWDFLEDWNVMAGARYDRWETIKGHFTEGGTITYFDDRSSGRVSPKFSLAFAPNDLSFRYSFSKAYRFPMAQELYDSVEDNTTDSSSVSDPGLGPETGYFHDFKVQYDLPEGYARASLFYNTIENEIMSTTKLNGAGSAVKTYQGIDKTETIGVELVYKQDYVLDLPIALNINGTWLNKEIVEHYQNAGKEWIRLPRYRASASATYHIMDNLDSTVSVRYRSNQFGQEDNSDNAQNVPGAQDKMTIVNFKTGYTHDLGDYKLKASIGVNNILDQDVWDHHPYPQRTYFANIGLKI